MPKVATNGVIFTHVTNRPLITPTTSPMPNAAPTASGMLGSRPFIRTAAAIPLIVATEPIDRSIPPVTTTKNSAAAAMLTKVAPLKRSEEHTSELQSHHDLV